MTIEATLYRIADALEIIAAGKAVTPRATHGVCVGEPIVVSSVPETAPAKRSRRTKAEMASAAATAGASASNPAPAAAKSSSKATTSAPTAAADSSGPTREDLRLALGGLNKATDVETVKRLLESFRAKTLSQVPEDKIAAVIARAAALTEAAANEAPAEGAAAADDPFA